MLNIRFRTALCVAALALLAAPLQGGNGRFKDGVFNFCVSVRFNATAAQLERIRAGFRAANQVLLDATDGQHRFGTITLINNFGGADVAEYWIHPGSGRADASVGNYGVRGEHVNLYFDDDTGNNNRAAYTIAHEHAHQAYGLWDEYKGFDLSSGGADPPVVDSECAAPAAESDTLNYCLMDNFFTRGGAFTLNEFCITANHDPDRDTDQSQQTGGDACWKTLSEHASRSANAPAMLPTSAAPANQAVTFRLSESALAAGDLRVMLVIDRSGSMRNERKIEFARVGAILFTLFVKDGQSLGLVQFNSDSQTIVPMQVVGPGVRSGVLRPAIDGITATGGTNIGAGLERALEEFETNPGGCNDVIVLLSDGDGTLTNSTVEKLKDAGVTVLAIGIGDSLSTSGQAKLQNVARETGGKFFRGTDSFDLITFFLLTVMEARAAAPISNSPLTLAPNAEFSRMVPVEPGSRAAVFAVNSDEGSGVEELALRSPSGQMINENSPGVETIVEGGTRSIEVPSPQAGDWEVLVRTGAPAQGEAEIAAFAEHDGVQLNVTVEREEVNFPDPVVVHATPRFEGRAVLGAEVSGVVRRPDGGDVPIMLLDNGSPLNGDRMPGDGVYSASFESFGGEGAYTFDLLTRAVNARTDPGEALFREVTGISDEQGSQPVPPFERSGSATAIVLGAPENNPVINAGGVVNAADFTGRLSRGSIGSLFGTGLAPSIAQASNVPLPTELGGVQVRVNGVLAPLFFVSPMQINFQIPFEAPLSGQVTIDVVNNGLVSGSQTVAVGPYAPGVFANPNTGEPIVTRPDGSLITAAAPAQPGEVLIVFLTGLGDLTDAPPTGEAATAAPLSRTRVNPTVTIGGLQAQVLFSGLAPFFVGLGQVNIRVPDAAAGLALTSALEGKRQGGGGLPLVVDYAGAGSTPINLPVQGFTAPNDISVEMVEVLPPFAIPDDIIFVRYRIFNPAGLTGEGTRDLYISTDAVIDPATDTLVNTRTFPLSGDPEEIIRSTSNDLPEGLAPGTYFAGVIIDVPGDSNPANNTAMGIPFEIVNQRPPFDLGVTLDSATPTTVGQGDPVDITYTPTGTDRLTGRFRRELYLSRDMVLDDDDDLINRRTFSINEGGLGSITSTNNILPRSPLDSGEQSATFYLILVVTREGDTNPADNVSAPLPITVTRERAPFDLGVTLLSVSPSTVAQGAALDVVYDIANHTNSVGRYDRLLILSTRRIRNVTDIMTDPSGIFPLNFRTFTLSGTGRQITSTNNIVRAIGQLTVPPGNYQAQIIISETDDFTFEANDSDNFSNALPVRVVAGAGLQLIEPASAETDEAEWESSDSSALAADGYGREQIDRP